MIVERQGVLATEGGTTTAAPWSRQRGQRSISVNRLHKRTHTKAGSSATLSVIKLMSSNMLGFKVISSVT